MEANTRSAGGDASVKNDVQTPFAASLGGSALILPYPASPFFLPLFASRLGK